MADDALVIKAKQILQRRDSNNGFLFYATYAWRRQLLFVAGYILVVVALVILEMHVLALAAGAFIAGTKLRDFRWWFALTREWPTTCELLDWHKIETLAESKQHD